MPMGDCDSLKKHISDFIEGNLDKATSDEFERGLNRDGELQKLTSRVGYLSQTLNKLPEHKCSSDFSARLRERIHRSDAPSRLPFTPVRKYSFAFSFVILAIVAVFAIANFGDQKAESSLQSETPVIKNANPVSTPVTSSAPAPSNKIAGQEVDIKTQGEQKAKADSVSKRELEGKNPKLKYVDDIK